MDCEMLAIVEALWHWWPYLHGKKSLYAYGPLTIDVLLCTTESFSLPTMLG